MKRQAATGEIVNRSALARVMGVSPTAIDSWLARGCPVITEPEPGKADQYRFDTAAVIQWRIGEAVSAERRKPREEQS